MSKGQTEKIEEKIDIFEQAIVTTPIEIAPVPISTILVGIDVHPYAFENSQSAVQVAQLLAKKHNAVVHVICIPTDPKDADISHTETEQIVNRLVASGIDTRGICILGTPSELILDAVREYNVDLIILPTYYAEDVEQPCPESLGTTLDIVLKRALCPVLIITTPTNSPESIFTAILLPILSNNVSKASEWTITLVEQGTKIVLLSLLEQASIRTTREVVQSFVDDLISERSVERILSKDVQMLLTKLTTHLMDLGYDVEKKHVVGDSVPAILDDVLKGNRTLIVIQTIPQHGNPIGPIAESLARLSPVPVLIVK